MSCGIMNKAEKVFLDNERLQSLAVQIFPPIESADKDGFLATGGDLSVNMLLIAYASGIFPWYSDGQPILWWSPDPRMILLPERFYVSKTLRKRVRDKMFQVRMDACFAEVIKACALTPRMHEDGTWITADMEAAYIDLHKEGYAHSVETYFEGNLVGGLYGVSLGKAFFGESMFHIMTDASKVALYYLVQLLRKMDFYFIDVQVSSQHLKSLGANDVPRKQFLSMLEQSLQFPTYKGPWTYNEN